MHCFSWSICCQLPGALSSSLGDSKPLCQILGTHICLGIRESSLNEEVRVCQPFVGISGKHPWHNSTWDLLISLKKPKWVWLEIKLAAKIVVTKFVVSNSAPWFQAPKFIQSLGAIAQPQAPIQFEWSAKIAGATLVLWSPLGTFWGAFIRVAQLKECSLGLETTSGSIQDIWESYEMNLVF